MAAKKKSRHTAPKPSAKTKKSRAARDTASKKAEALRKLLIQKREQLIKEANIEVSKYIKGETKQIVDTALDDGDWSVVDISEDVSLGRLSAQREVMVKIDAAIRKLDEGTYGICEECGGKISEERLKVIPFAIYCRDCQEKIEQLEAVEKELPI
ncbi:MAG: transcriptional regulator, TraR/DksA family protein [Nitrospirae bacterium CG_4_8_14_3_um_filter_44_28]|nr:MAG: transcriptional regulator, TraR/DksA family protein [Nitrospirae bacterium CG_4_8_14_3_um_filter_44_28]